MTKLATAYAYDEHGAYLGETDVQEIEGRPGEYNMIPGCTLEPPPETDDQHYPRWTGDKWVVERVLSQIERYKAGIDPVPDGMTVDGDDLRPMIRAELVAAGKLTQTEADRMDLMEEEGEHLAYLASTDWYAIRLAETGEEPPLEVSDQRQYARNRISEIREQLKTEV